MRTALIVVLITALAGAEPAPARAEDAPDVRLGMGLRAVTSGKTPPAILLRPQEKVRKVVVKLTPKGGGKTITLKATNLRPGRGKQLAIPQKPGSVTWTAEVDVTWGDKSTTTFTTGFETTLVGKLEIRITPADVDMDTRKMAFSITNPAKRAELGIYGESGKRLGTVEEDFDAAAPGTPLVLDWSDVAGDILYMELKVWDIAGFWAGLRITPFSIEIPHDDVEFSSGSAAIAASEAPKLQATMKLIREALAKHGTLLQLKLFVAGYTDTVSSRDYNQNLSTQRARSIAAWFRRHGLKIPIYYQGFGEDVLAVPTPDNTPEPRNRRAMYILSSQKPGASKAIPRDNWKRL